MYDVGTNKVEQKSRDTVKSVRFLAFNAEELTACDDDKAATSNAK